MKHDDHKKKNVVNILLYKQQRKQKTINPPPFHSLLSCLLQSSLQALQLAHQTWMDTQVFRLVSFLCSIINI